MHLLAAVLLAVLLQCADAENLCDVDKRRDVIFLVRRFNSIAYLTSRRSTLASFKFLQNPRRCKSITSAGLNARTS